MSMEGRTPLAGKQMSLCNICNLDASFVSRLRLNDGNLVQAIRCSDTAIHLCRHSNCLGERHVLPFCLRSCQPPRGSRPLLPDSRNLQDELPLRVRAQATMQWRPFLKITLVTSPPPSDSNSRSWKKLQKIPTEHKNNQRSSENKPTHTAPLRAAAQFNTTAAPSWFQRSDELAVIDCRESVRTWKLMVRRALFCHLMSSALWRPTWPIQLVLSGCGRFMRLLSWGRRTQLHQLPVSHYRCQRRRPAVIMKLTADVFRSSVSLIRRNRLVNTRWRTAVWHRWDIL